MKLTQNCQSTVFQENLKIKKMFSSQKGVILGTLCEEGMAQEHPI